jgi:Tfp pilus assembly protein PilN
VIKINLTPIEELENPYWWAPDLAASIVIVGLTFGAVYYHVSSAEGEINQRASEKQRLIDETMALNADVDKFNSLSGKIATLESRKNALRQITESKLVRYLPIILLENIQNLKPDGVWLNSLAFVDKKLDRDGAQAAASAAAPANPPAEGGAPADTNAAANPPAPAPNLFTDYKQSDFPITIEISGSAKDNVRIAEFMMALKATQNQSFEKSDLRTQLFFSNVGIGFSQIRTQQNQNGPAGGGGSQTNPSIEFVTFKLQLSFRERGSSGENNAKFSQFIEDFNRTGSAVMH